MQIKQYQTTKYIMGNGALREVQRWKDKRIGLVVDENVLKALQLETKLFDELLKDCDYEVLCNMPQEPTTELLEPAIRKAQRFDPDVFVAIGGGSVLDSAKVLWLFTEFPDYTWEQAFAPYAVESFTKEKELIAIPTTSGTGSETTGCAVVKDTEKRKCMVLSNEIMPSTAILDYELLVSLPKHVIAFSGCDALAHALEAGISVLASDMVRMQSVQAAVQIIKQLEASCNGDLNARRDIHLGNDCGACINNSITGMAHGMDQAGGDFRKPHGLMTAYPAVYDVSRCRSLYMKVADQLGICGTSMEKQSV
ncbi:MAG: iron-containing alcohol dehydrogenase [[Clostridium] innocuum]